MVRGERRSHPKNQFLTRAIHHTASLVEVFSLFARRYTLRHRLPPELKRTLPWLTVRLEDGVRRPSTDLENLSSNYPCGLIHPFRFGKVRLLPSHPNALGLGQGRSRRAGDHAKRRDHRHSASRAGCTTVMNALPPENRGTNGYAEPLGHRDHPQAIVSAPSAAAAPSSHDLTLLDVALEPTTYLIPGCGTTTDWRFCKNCAMV
jgi:hypothetical protein